MPGLPIVLKMPVSVGLPAVTDEKEDLIEESRRLYECAVLYPLHLSQKDENEFFKSVEAFFAEAGGEQVAKDMWGRRGLAYPIGGVREGNVAVYHYRISPTNVREIDRQIRILPGVLRHLIVALPDGHAIVRYSQLFEAWREDEKNREVQERVKKEEKLRKRVIERVAKRAVPEKAARSDVPLAEEALKEGIEKIISDEDIRL